MDPTDPIKVVVVGDCAAGKTALIRSVRGAGLEKDIRPGLGGVQPAYQSTTSSRYDVVTVNDRDPHDIPGSPPGMLGFFDTPGGRSHEIAEQRRWVYPAAKAVVLVFSLADPAAPAAVAEFWGAEIARCCPEGTPVVLVGTHADLAARAPAAGRRRRPAPVARRMSSATEPEPRSPPEPIAIEMVARGADGFFAPAPEAPAVRADGAAVCLPPTELASSDDGDGAVYAYIGDPDYDLIGDSDDDDGDDASDDNLDGGGGGGDDGHDGEEYVDGGGGGGGDDGHDGEDYDGNDDGDIGGDATCGDGVPEEGHFRTVTAAQVQAMATSVNAVDYVECSATALPGVHRLFAVVMDATQRRPGSPWQPASHEGRQPKEPRGVLSRMFGTFRRSKQHANPRLSHRRRRPAAAAAATPPLVATSQGVDSGRELLAVSKYCANFKVDVDPPGPGTPQPAPPAPPTPPPTPIMARAAAISLMLQGRVSGHARRHTPQRSPAALRPPPLPTVAAPSLSPSARPPPLPTLAAPLLNLPPGVAAASGTADGHGHAGGNCAGTEAAVLRGDDVGGVAGACAVPSPLLPPPLPPALQPRVEAANAQWTASSSVDDSDGEADGDGCAVPPASRPRPRHRKHRRRSSTQQAGGDRASAIGGQGGTDTAQHRHSATRQSRFVGIRASLFRKHLQRSGRHGSGSTPKPAQFTRPGSRADASQRRRRSSALNLQMQRALLGMSYGPILAPGEACENVYESIEDVAATGGSSSSSSSSNISSNSSSSTEPVEPVEQHRAGASMIDFSALSKAEVDLFRVLLQTAAPNNQTIPDTVSDTAPATDPAAHRVPDGGTCAADVGADVRSCPGASHDTDAQRRCTVGEDPRGPAAATRPAPRCVWRVDAAVDGSLVPAVRRAPAEAVQQWGGGEQLGAGPSTTLDREEDAFEAMCQSYGVLGALGLAEPPVNRLRNGSATAQGTPPLVATRPPRLMPLLTANKPKTAPRVPPRKPRDISSTARLPSV